MNPSKILIAAATVILLSSIFSGCSKNVQEVTHEAASKAPAQLIQEARELTKEVSFDFDYKITDDELKVTVMLDNPNKKPITSVQSWLSYNPKVLKGNRIEVSTSPFIFTAPYDNTFNDVNGLVMIGRSNSEPISTQSIVVAEVVFDILKEETTMIDVYDYRTNLTGHASANMMLDGWPYNILKKPESPVLVIKN